MWAIVRSGGGRVGTPRNPTGWHPRPNRCPESTELGGWRYIFDRPMPRPKPQPPAHGLRFVHGRLQFLRGSILRRRRRHRTRTTAAFASLALAPGLAGGGGVSSAGDLSASRYAWWGDSLPTIVSFGRLGGCLRFDDHHGGVLLLRESVKPRPTQRLRIPSQQEPPQQQSSEPYLLSLPALASTDSVLGPHL